MKPRLICVLGVRDMETLDALPDSQVGYAEWHELAAWRQRKGYRQKRCKGCKRYYWNHKQCECGAVAS